VRGVSLKDVIGALRDRSLDTLEDYRRRGVDTQAVARKLHQASLKQILMDGVFHADSHPANLLVLPDGALAYVDFGIVGRLDEDSRATLLEYMEAVARGDLQETYRALCKIGIVTSRTDLRGFEQDIKLRTRQWFQDVSGRVASVRERSMAVYMIDTMRIIKERGMGIPFDILSFYRTVIAVDSVILQLTPAFDPTDDARQVFGKWKIDSLLRMLSPSRSLETIGSYYVFVSSLPRTINRAFGRRGISFQCVESESQPSGQCCNNC
jgi:ubiquinone biosynthesis protein